MHNCLLRGVGAPIATEAGSTAKPSTTLMAGAGDEVQELSAELRAQTSDLHREIERLLNLPDAISTRDDYQRWLAGFLGFYQPLEARLTSFPDWERLGISLASRLHVPCLVHDLAALGRAPDAPPVAMAERLPELPTIAHALGALYVIEGATLGGQIILRAIEARPGVSIGLAKRFFGGRGRDTGLMWIEFRQRLDGFGRDHPVRRNDVIAGARHTFQSLLTWFGPNSASELVHER